MTAPSPSPEERLLLSRERLRVALARETAPREDGSARSDTDLFDALKTFVPGAEVLLDTLGQWTRHPLHTTGVVAGSVVQGVLRPLAQRHPLALVAGALVLGALLAVSRPWRWAFRFQLLRVVGPALLSSLLASAAVRSWLANLTQNQQEASVPE